MEKRRSNNRDRISALSVELLQEILSLLPLRDAVRTSALSTTWRHDWVAVTSLDFVEASARFLPEEIPLDGVDSGRIARYSGALRRVMEERRRHGPRELRGLRLLVPHLRPEDADDYYCLLRQWVEFAATSPMLQELRCERHSTDRGTSEAIIEFQNSVLSCTPLTTLELCGFDITGDTVAKIDLPNLKKLSISSTHIDQGALDSLLTGCQGSLEDLSIVGCRGFEAIRGSGLARLRRLEVVAAAAVKRVSIGQATGLEELMISGASVGCEVALPPAMAALTDLCLEGCGIEDGPLSRHLSHMGRLQSLSLGCCNRLRHMNVVSQTLQSLEVRWCCNLERLDLDCSNLKAIEIECPKLSSIIEAKSEPY